MSEWIKVEDRLPGCNGEYLCLESDDRPTPYYSDDCPWHEIVDFSAGDFDCQMYETVTHWMPLPAPPQDKND